MKKSLKSLLRYSSLTAVILLFSIVFALGLNYFKFQKSVTNLSNERFVINISEIKKQAEQSLNLGFDIADLPIDDNDLKEIQNSDNLVSNVLILGAKGQTLRSSEKQDNALSDDLVHKVLIHLTEYSYFF